MNIIPSVVSVFENYRLSITEVIFVSCKGCVHIKPPLLLICGQLNIKTAQPRTGVVLAGQRMREF